MVGPDHGSSAQTDQNLTCQVRSLVQKLDRYHMCLSAKAAIATYRPQQPLYLPSLALMICLFRAFIEAHQIQPKSATPLPLVTEPIFRP